MTEGGAVAEGLWVLGTISGQPVALLDLGVATGLSILGALSFQFLKAYAAREQEAQKGLPEASRTRVDWLSLLYALLAAPLATGLLFYLISSLGGTANSLYSIGGFYAAGAMAPQLIPLALSAISKVLGAVSPAGASGVKP